MHRQSLLNKLSAYRAANEEERRLQEQVKQFVSDNPDCFERTLAAGHITGAAWIVNPLRTHVLLTHHRKLNRWLQLGGHADSDADILRVAIREAQEESGIPAFIPLSEEIFDIDVHEIPPHNNVPRHLHYDIRFLLETDMKTEIKASDESHEIRWILLDRVPEFTREPSILRMLKKTMKWSR